MTRSETNVRMLVVEGDDDAILLGRHVSQDVMLIGATGGKPSVLSAAEKADAEHLVDVWFLVDEDYDALLLGTRPVYPSSVIATIYHDLFMELVFGAAQLINRVIETHCRHIRRSESAAKLMPTEDLIDAAIKLSTEISMLRIVNQREGFGLRLADFPVGAIKLNLDVADQICALAIQRADEPKVTVEDLVRMVRDEPSHINFSTDLLVGDHDFFRALSLILRKRARVTVGSDELVGSLLLAIDCQALTSTAQSLTGSAVEKLVDQRLVACPCAA